MRITLEVREPVLTRVQEMGHRLGHKDVGHTIQHAMALFDLVSDVIGSGGTVIIRSKDGNETKLKLP